MKKNCRTGIDIHVLSLLILDAILQARQEEVDQIFHSLAVFKTFLNTECPSRELILVFSQVTGISEALGLGADELPFYTIQWQKLDPCIIKARNDFDIGLRAQGLSSWVSRRRPGYNPKHWNRSLVSLRRKVDNLVLRHDDEICTAGISTSLRCAIRLLCETRYCTLLNFPNVPVKFTWNTRRKDMRKDVGWRAFDVDGEDQVLLREWPEDSD